MKLTEAAVPANPTAIAAVKTPRRSEASSEETGTHTQSQWHREIWIGVGIALALTGFGLFYFVGSTVSRVGDLVAAHSANDRVFAFSGMTLITLTLLRLLAMLIGAGMVFGGLAVSFHTHAQATQMSAKKGSTAQASLATSSPGIAAIVVGAIVILCALFNRGEYFYRPLAGVPLGAAQLSKDTSVAPDGTDPPARYRSAEEVLKDLER